MIRIVLTVTTDLSYDQRMIRICHSLATAGYEVLLVGRSRPVSIPLQDRSFNQKRLSCWFSQGKLFYVEYNIRLFFFLLFRSCDIICGIDLDTALAAFLAAKLKAKVFVHDQHEYFTELEEVVNRPRIKAIWKAIEKIVLPRARYGYTINHTYASLFKEQYGVSLEVIRNASVWQNSVPLEEPSERYILYQGAVNHGRGLPQLIRAMQEVDCALYICGLGDIYDQMQALVNELGLRDRVKFLGYVEPEPLRKITRQAYIGTTLFEKAGRSNYYSLANRFFDYIHAETPQICMNYPEYYRINAEFEVAVLLNEPEEQAIAKALNGLLADGPKYRKLKQNCRKAREKYNWQREEAKLLAYYQKIAKDNGLKD